MRLIPFVDLPVVSQQPLSGPEAVNGSSGTSIGNFTQSVSSPFGAWVFKFTFAALTPKAQKKLRGWMVALQRGSNATRWKLTDRNLIMAEDYAVSPPSGGGMPWESGQNWQNGQPWKFTIPSVPVAQNSSKDSSIIKISQNFWGGGLDIGDRIGFFPFHFGMYMITEVLSSGEYRVWPPLRKSITVTDFATLYPVMAMRLLGSDVEYPTEDVEVTTGSSVTLLEVFDYDVRKYFDG
jgi:hypothetical protein